MWAQIVKYYWIGSPAESMGLTNTEFLRATEIVCQHPEKRQIPDQESAELAMKDPQKCPQNLAI